MSSTTARIIVEGRVQGVWYRGSAREEATRLGIAGFARNLPDGTVEIVAEGEKERIERLIAWCHKGPPGARVSGVRVTWDVGEGGFEGFSIRW